MAVDRSHEEAVLVVEGVATAWLESSSFSDYCEKTRHLMQKKTLKTLKRMENEKGHDQGGDGTKTVQSEKSLKGING